MIKTWIDFKPEKYLDYKYEPPVQFLGWLLELYPVAVVILIGVWNVWKNKRQGNSVAFFRVGPMLEPKSTWGPRPDREHESNEEISTPSIEANGTPSKGQHNHAFD